MTGRVMLRKIYYNSLLLMSSVVACLVAGCESEFGEQLPPKIYFASEGYFEMEPNDTLKLEPKIVYDLNSTYTWYVDGKPVSNELNYYFVPDGMKDYELAFSVANSFGADTSKVEISVLKNIDFSSFLNYTFPKKATIAMEVDTLENLGGFVQKDILFKSTVLARDTNNVAIYHSGFAASSKATTTTSLGRQAWGCAYVSNNGSNCYMSVSCDESPATVVFDREYSVKSLKLANDNYVYLISKYGAMTADSSVVLNYAQKDDYYRIRISGLDANGNATGAEVAYDLINCDADNPAKYIRRNDWMEIDMAELGHVYGLSMEVECTMADYPLLFCVDEIKLQD